MNTKTVVYLIITAALLIGIFYLIKPKSIEETQLTNPVAQEPVVSEKIFEMVVKARKIVSGRGDLKANEGDQVTIKITVDEPEELHIHGYDKSVELEKDVLGELSFIATLTGRFPFELENSKTELGALEVLPK